MKTTEIIKRFFLMILVFALLVSCNQEPEVKRLSSDFSWTSTPYYGQTVANFKSTLRVVGYWSDGTATNEEYSSVFIREIASGATLADSDAFKADTEYEVTIETESVEKGAVLRKSFKTASIPATEIASLEIGFKSLPKIGDTLEKILGKIEVTAQLSNGAETSDLQKEVKVYQGEAELSGSLAELTAYSIVVDVTYGGKSYKASKSFTTPAAVLTSITALDISFKSLPKAGEAIESFKNRIEVIALMSDGTSESDLDSTVLTITKDGEAVITGNLVDSAEYTIAAKVSLNGKDYSTSMTFTAPDAVKTAVSALDVNLKSLPKIGDSYSTLLEKIEVLAQLSDGTVTSELEKTVKVYNGATELSESLAAVTAYTIKVEVTYDGKLCKAEKNFITPAAIPTSVYALNINLKALPAAGEAISSINTKIELVAQLSTGASTSTLENPQIVIKKGGTVVVSDPDTFVKDAEYTIYATAEYNDKVYYSQKTFKALEGKVLLSCDVQYVTTPYPGETDDEFFSSLRIFGKFSDGTSVQYKYGDAEVQVESIYGGWAEGKFIPGTEYSYEVSLTSGDRTVTARVAFTVGNRRNPRRIFFSGRNTINSEADNTATTSFITDHDFQLV